MLRLFWRSARIGRAAPVVAALGLISLGCGEQMSLQGGEGVDKAESRIDWVSGADARAIESTLRHLWEAAAFGDSATVDTLLAPGAYDEFYGNDPTFFRRSHTFLIVEDAVWFDDTEVGVTIYTAPVGRCGSKAPVTAWIVEMIRENRNWKLKQFYGDLC